MVADEILYGKRAYIMTLIGSPFDPREQDILIY